jgi:menaquinone-dependent protoporphyrinogen oxidase
MMKILVAYASAHGSTAEVAAFIGRVLSVYDAEVTVEHADMVKSVDEYDMFILGSPIHSSMWLPSLSQFMFRFEEKLSNSSVYLWISCLIVLEEGGYDKVISSHMWDEALDKLGVARPDIGVFAGKLDWQRISGNEKWLMSNNYEGKELPGNMRGDYRNWKEIAAWTHDIAQKMRERTDMDPVHADDHPMVKDETITEEGVKNLHWPDNPGETGSI